MPIHASSSLNPLVNPARPGDTIIMPSGKSFEVGSSARAPLTVLDAGQQVFATDSQVELVAWFVRQEGRLDA